MIAFIEKTKADHRKAKLQVRSDAEKLANICHVLLNCSLRYSKPPSGFALGDTESQYAKHFRLARSDG